ncbi:MAG: M23 family metallopeptidase [Campylobacterales bacterium]|nr:M23 family metallopeptidase [Campylobacterales bacterium]
MKFKEKKRSSGGIVALLVLSVVLGAIGYVYFSPQFEQMKPSATLYSKEYWNLQSKLKITLEDNVGIKYYKITFKDADKETELASEVLANPVSKVTLELDPPKLDMFYKQTDVKIVVEVIDNSKWNYLEGNKFYQEFPMKIDTKKPTANVIGNSRYIQRGGSAVVVTKVFDENIKDAYISFNDEKNFKLQPYLKDGYFVSLIAWPMDIDEFKRVNLVVIDKADNITITKVPLYIQEKTVKPDRITLTDDFIKNVSANVIEQSYEKVPTDLKDIFVYSNKDIRMKNLQTIETTALKALEGKTIESFDIEAFKRLRGSKTISNYGELRQYYLNNEMINEAWHLGIDWASVKKAPIRVSNNGEVIFKDYLGLYGNTIIIDHGMGLCSLYGHTSTQNVNVGDRVTKDQMIAHTGATGAVFGDHLHFGIVVQGVEVNPIEWMDKNWIKTRITDILESSKKYIESTK